MNKAGPEPRCWSFSFAFLPPGVNHMYQAIGQGKKALTEDALDKRAHIAVAADRAGFAVEEFTRYGVRLVFTMPGWSQDIDGPVKAALDAIFIMPGHRNAWDHHIVQLEVEKRVQRGQRRTDVTIWEIA